MKPHVKDDGIRPAGSPDRCFYCDFPKGTHNSDCVCVTKMVVLEIRIPYIVFVPDSWSAADIEFHRNEGSFCLGTDIQQIADEDMMEGMPDESGCNICHRAEVRYLRDATDEDEEELLPTLDDESITVN